MISQLQANSRTATNQASQTEGKNQTLLSRFASYSKRILAVLGGVTAGAMVASAPAYADPIDKSVVEEVKKRDWKQVNEEGIGAGDFSKKAFGTNEWRLLVDNNGKRLENPSKLRLGNFYVKAGNERDAELVSRAVKSMPEHFRFSNNGSGKFTDHAKRPTYASSVSGSAANKVQIPPKIQTAEPILVSQFSTGPLKELLAQKTPRQIGKQELLLALEQMGFNMTLYKTVVWNLESKREGYLARNDKTAKRLGITDVPVNKVALGKHQIIVWNLERGYNKDLKDENGNLDDSKVNAYLHDAAEQERIMTDFTLGNIKSFILTNKAMMDAIFESEHPGAAMAEFALAGHQSVYALKVWDPEKGFNEKLKDYFETKNHKYKSEGLSMYLAAMGQVTSKFAVAKTEAEELKLKMSRSVTNPVAITKTPATKKDEAREVVARAPEALPERKEAPSVMDRAKTLETQAKIARTEASNDQAKWKTESSIFGISIPDTVVSSDARTAKKPEMLSLDKALEEMKQADKERLNEIHANAAEKAKTVLDGSKTLQDALAHHGLNDPMQLANKLMTSANAIEIERGKLIKAMVYLVQSKAAVEAGDSSKAHLIPQLVAAKKQFENNIARMKSEAANDGRYQRAA